jgi:hypothetical protein
MLFSCGGFYTRRTRLTISPNEGAIVEYMAGRDRAGCASGEAPVPGSRREEWLFDLAQVTATSEETIMGRLCIRFWFEVGVLSGLSLVLTSCIVTYRNSPMAEVRDFGTTQKSIVTHMTIPSFHHMDRMITSLQPYSLLSILWFRRPVVIRRLQRRWWRRKPSR